MANQIYPSFLQQLMEQYFKVDAPWTADSMDVFVVGVGPEYEFATTHHEVEDLGLNIVFEPIPVPDVTLTGGVFAAGDAEGLIESEAGETVKALVLFCANNDGSQLIAYIDEGQPMQLPMTLIVGQLFVRWNAAGIFRI